MQHYVIKFVSELRQVGGFLKTDRHDITEILLKVALNTIKQTKKQKNRTMYILFFNFCKFDDTIGDIRRSR